MNDDWENILELAGYKGHKGMEKFIKYGPFLEEDDLLGELKSTLGKKCALVEDRHPYPSPCDDQLPSAGISFGRIVRMDGKFGPLAYVQTETQDRHPHILICGSSGTGKSVTMRYLIQQFTLNGVGSLILDTEGEYSNLLCYLPRNLCWIFNDNTFKRNPLQPLPGEERRRTFGRVKRIFRETFLRDGSINLLGEELVNIIDYVGHEPTLHRLVAQLGRARFRLDSRRGQYLESLKNRVGNIVEFVDIYDCEQGYDIRDWLGAHCLVLRLEALSDELKDFVVNELVASIQDWTQQNPDSSLRLLIGTDEAHRPFSPGKASRYDLGDPIILDAARTFRKRSVNFILSTQLFSDLPPALLANVSTFLVFRTSGGQSQRAIAQALSLTKEQMEYLPKLGERRAVLKHPLIPDPFIVELPELDFSQCVSEEEIRRTMAPILERLRWVPRTQSEGTSAGRGGGGWDGSNESARAQDRCKGRNQHEQQEQAPVSKDELRLGQRKREALEYLDAIQKNPFPPATERDRLLGLSSYKGNLLRKVLSEKGLITVHQLSTGHVGNTMTLLEITNRGWEFLRDEGFKIHVPRGHGSWRHRYFQNKLQRWFLENYPGCKAEIEQQEIGNKAVDIGVEIGGRKIAVEVQIEGEEKELNNIVRDLEAGWDEVIICSQQKDTLERIKKRLKDAFGDEYDMVVSFKELREFLA